MDLRGEIKIEQTIDESQFQEGTKEKSQSSLYWLYRKKFLIAKFAVSF